MDTSKLTKEDYDFIMTALNHIWNDHHQKLHGNNLGDIERKSLEFGKNKAKEIMQKLDR